MGAIVNLGINGMVRVLRRLLVAGLTGWFLCGTGVAHGAADVNEIAESYVRLVLQVGLYDRDYVDAYFGPAEWKPAEADRQEPFPAERLGARANTLIGHLAGVRRGRLTEAQRARWAYLEKQLVAVRAKIELLGGRKMSFDEESRALYDVVAPAHEEAYFQGIVRELGEALPPGEDDIYSRFNSYRSRFTIPRDKLEEVMTAAVAEYRRRTLEHIPLPAGERFDLRFVGNQPWHAYASYQGGGLSLIEVNADMPFGIVEAADVAAHEVYPGHHVHLTLLDQHLVQGKGWMEFSVVPLYSPLALVCEGIAEYGCLDLVMRPAERLRFARDVLFPRAGLDAADAERYERVMDLKNRLDAAQVEAARRFLDGRMDRDKTRDWLCDYGLVTPAVAENLIDFFERYRSYVVNYTVGRQLVADYIDRHSGPDRSPARRWQAFHTLLTTPQTPSGLAAAQQR
jgi:hypothetical protein